MLIVKVDDREHAVWDKLQQMELKGIEKCRLELGDFQIWKDDQLLSIWERKTWSDLKSSIRDGRKKEQLSRIDLVYPNGVEKIFLLETNRFFQEDYVLGSFLRVSERDGWKILRSNNPTETAKLISMTMYNYQKYPRSDARLTSEHESSILSQTVLSSRQAHLSRSKSILVQFSGVSPQIATMLDTKYGLSKLIQYATICSNNDICNELENLQIGRTKWGKRGKKFWEEFCSVTTTTHESSSEINSVPTATPCSNETKTDGLTPRSTDETEICSGK